MSAVAGLLQRQYRNRRRIICLCASASLRLSVKCVVLSFSQAKTLRRQDAKRLSFAALVSLSLFLVLGGCSSRTPDNKPIVEFTDVPAADKGGSGQTDTIQGRALHATPDQRIVLYARSGAWYVQPYVEEPFTKIGPNSIWINSTHLGTEYAALLVNPGYVPPSLAIQLPTPGGDVIAVAVVEGKPEFYHSWWFRLVLVILGSLALLTLYRWRLHQLSAELNLRFEERLAERTRIAQDLHDTMLQGMISASMQLHVANDLLEANSPAKPLVNRVVTLMGQVIEEGRDTVRGLRSKSDRDDLQTAFSNMGKELAIDQVGDFRVIVEGTPRELHPIIRDEAYRIGREALVNALRHARASKIEVELEYSSKQLRLLVRDDGTGIDPNVLVAGREGHWGLTGMRERAEAIDARVTVWSRAKAGTEIELIIPAHVAYEPAPGQRRVSNLFQRIFRGSPATQFRGNTVSEKEKAT
jgi:signal transduction histidine kinase